MGPTFCHDALGCTALCWHEQAWHVGRENHSLVDMDVHVAINEPVACETNLWPMDKPVATTCNARSYWFW